MNQRAPGERRCTSVGIEKETAKRSRRRHGRVDQQGIAVTELVKNLTCGLVMVASEQVGHPTAAVIWRCAVKLIYLWNQLTARTWRVLYAVHEAQGLGQQQAGQQREPAHGVDHTLCPLRWLARAR